MKPENEGLIQIIEGEEYQRFKIQKLRKRIKKEKKLNKLISLAGFSCFGSSSILGALGIIGINYALSLFTTGLIIRAAAIIPLESIAYKEIELRERMEELKKYLKKDKNIYSRITNYLN